jgi:PAS domain S-box-containing protein
MDKKQYIELETAKLLQYWGSFAIASGAFVIMSLSVLDYFVTPENFSKFLTYRSITAFLFIIIFVINRLTTNQYLILSASVFAGLLVSIMVELMILSFGGHQSIYYVGMIIVFMFCLGFLPLFSIKFTVLMGTLIYSIYLLPILIFDNITNVPVFINSNVFLIATAIIAISWRYYNDELFTKKLSLEYDLSRDKEQLEKYSLQLEDLVTERTKELNKSEQWHRALFANATDGIIVLDKNGIIVNANEKACEMHSFTREALVGAHIKLLEAETDKEQVSDRMRQILAGASLVFETKHNKKDGTAISLEVSSKAIAVGDELLIQSFYRDITERKKFQEHLSQSQKMESIGVLAGGIAHDFNNILTAILGHSEIIRKNSVLDVKSTNSLGVIEDASRRAGRMISRLLGFARKSKYEIVPLQLNDVVYDTLKLLERVIDKNIELTVELDSHLPLIQGDTNHIEQIVMNLIINARDAMPKGGKIVIKTSVVDVVQGMPDIPNYILPGEYIVFSLSDTGTGIPKDILNRIFEPFFTTKERGKGTGLGLSMVYGAVKEHKGYITVASEPGAGTLFTIYLPASHTAALAREKELLTSVGGNETLLIVDDEKETLNAVQEALTSHGYKTFAIGDSPSALSIFKKIPQEIALVITDIAMPHMDGMELIKQIKEIKPEIKIIAMSGHTKYIADKDGIREIDGFLKKPFESPYLLSVVRRILDAKAKTALTTI